MRSRVFACSGRSVLRFVAVGLLAGASAACSDSGRFADNPFTNPFASAATGKVDKVTTGALPSRSAPLGAVTSQPLPSALPRATVSNPLNPAQKAGTLAATPLPRVASTTLQNASPVAGSAAGWTGAGGTPVVVGAGDTANALSARYGVPAAAITAANPGGIRPGQQAIIPVMAGGAAAQARSGLMQPVAQPVTQPSVLPPTVAQPVAPQARVTRPVAPAQAAAVPLPPQRPFASPAPVASQEAPRPLAMKPLKPANAAKPDADDDDEDDKPAGRIVAAAPKTASLAPAATKPVIQPAAPKTAAAKPAEPKAAPAQKTAQVLPPKAAKPVKPEAGDEEEDVAPAKAQKPASQAQAPAQTPAAQQRPKPRVIPLTPQAPQETPKPVVEAPKAADPVTTAAIPPKAPEAAGDKPDFRWPAKGRVISGFGSKGGNGDGIAIAVPEGTQVKAAEGGTVAYAGEELKGYGKLVLVRHDNGYVTAYAHNGELNVKRGDKVARGQTIAKSGSTGNVTSPQLHFELRKGSTPVDPTKYLEN